MLKKIVTTVGLVSVFGASTTMAADVNLSAAAFTPYKIANETLATNNTTTGTGANLGTTYFDIANGAASDLDVVMTAGFAGSTTGTADYYVKVELTNAAYATAAEAMTVTATGSQTSVLFSGGLVGSSSAIYQFDISDPTTATTTLGTAFTDLATNGNPTVKMSIFETLTEANKAAGTSLSSASKQIAAIAAGITNKAVPNATAQNAEVSTAFKKFVGTPPGVTANVGTIKTAVTATYVDASVGTVATLTDLYTNTTSVATFTGDLSNGTWWMSAACAEVAIPAADKLTLNAAKTAGTIVTTNLGTKFTLCNRTDGVEIIPKSAYTVGINYTAGNGSSAGALDFTGLVIGAIGRNGTTQNINYLTTFSSYNQRVYITNRGTADATYSFAFQTEDGTTATAGTAATGTSKGSSVLVLKAADIVTLTGKTRTAATLSIVGTPGNFGIATQQVNLSNGATDTVLYKSD
jgi:hypothetical protein